MGHLPVNKGAYYSRESVLMAPMATNSGMSLPPLPFPTDIRIVAEACWMSPDSYNTSTIAPNIPVWVFCTGNYKDAFPFAKCFLYPSFLTLEEKRMKIRFHKPSLGLVKKNHMGCKTGQRGKVFATMPDDLSSIPGIHMSGENRFLQVVLSSAPPMHHYT